MVVVLHSAALPIPGSTRFLATETRPAVAASVAQWTNQYRSSDQWASNTKRGLAFPSSSATSPNSRLPLASSTA